MNSVVKPAIASKTIIGAVIALVAAATPLIGITLTADDQAVLVEHAYGLVILISNLIAIGGALLAMWGRLKANTRIGGTIHADSKQAVAPSGPNVTAADLNREELRRHLDRRGNPL